MTKVSKTKRKLVFEKSTGKCASCGKQCKYEQHGAIWNIDHITEQQFGGSSEIDNLQLLCLSCHKWKNICIQNNKIGFDESRSGQMKKLNKSIEDTIEGMKKCIKQDMAELKASNKKHHTELDESFHKLENKCIAKITHFTGISTPHSDKIEELSKTMQKISRELRALNRTHNDEQQKRHNEQHNHNQIILFVTGTAALLGGFTAWALKYKKQ